MVPWMKELEDMAGNRQRRLDFAAGRWAMTFAGGLVSVGGFEEPSNM
jgi:hypothetical protein